MSDLDEYLAHDCYFPEVEIGPGDFGPDDLLQPGMKLLTPCKVCGETPLDHLSLLEDHAEEMTRALIAHEPRRVLYHWSPLERRKQIVKKGLVPFSRSVTSTVRTNVICFADSPSWAWALSGAMNGSGMYHWDLWQTTLDLIEEPVILPSPYRASGIHEVRTTHRVFKRNLWYVATRVGKPPRRSSPRRNSRSPEQTP